MGLYVGIIVRREAGEAIRSGLVYGITPNPFLFRSGLDKPLLRLVEELLPYVGNEFHVQVPGRSCEEVELYSKLVKVFERAYRSLEPVFRMLADMGG